MNQSQQLFNDLTEYLVYMRQLGLKGLALEENPFRAALTAKPVPSTDVRQPAPKPTNRGPAESRPVAPESMVPRPGAPPKRPSGATAGRAPLRRAPQHKSRQNVFAGMNESFDSPTETNRLKAQGCKGESAEDILRALYGAFHTCQACALGTTRNRFVFGEGPADADLMFVGEGPGRDEDASGRPFVGKAGQLLNKIIDAMGFARHEVFIANVVKCRPPGNRTPLPDEMATCAPILTRQIEVIDPKIIVVLGATALRYFRGAGASIMRMRGTFFEWRGYTIMPTFHPAYILRNPRSKREVWNDMQQVMARIKAEKAG